MRVSSTFVTQAAVSTVSLIVPNSTETVSLVSVCLYYASRFFRFFRPCLRSILSAVSIEKLFVVSFQPCLEDYIVNFLVCGVSSKRLDQITFDF
jgi:hypothetical protein